MKSRFLFLVCCCWMEVGFAADDPEIQPRLEKILREKRWERVDLSPADQKEFITYAKKRLSETKGTIDESRWSNALVVLGDEETIRSYVKTEGDVRSNFDRLVASGSPIAIEVLVPFLFKEEPLTNQFASDVEIVSISHFVADRVIPDIILKSKEFNPQVTEWARKLRNTFKPNDSSGQLIWSRDITRAWWRNNEQFFRAKNYKSVQPGLQPPWPAPAPPPPDEPGPIATSEPAPRPGSPPVSDQNSSPALVSTPAVPLAQTPSEISDSPGLWLFATIALLALVIAVPILVARRK